MGKRKKSGRKPPPKRKQGTLPSVFQCLFCNHENSVVVKLEKKLGIGQLNCKVCGQTFQTGINYLSAPVDVYYDWVDACEEVAKEHAAQGGDPDAAPAPRQSGTVGMPSRSGGVKLGRNNAAPTERAAGGSGYTAAGDQDDFVVEDEEDAEGDFADEVL